MGRLFVHPYCHPIIRASLMENVSYPPNIRFAPGAPGLSFRSNAATQITARIFPPFAFPLCRAIALFPQSLTFLIYLLVAALRLPLYFSTQFFELLVSVPVVFLPFYLSICSKLSSSCLRRPGLRRPTAPALFRRPSSILRRRPRGSRTARLSLLGVI